MRTPAAAAEFCPLLFAFAPFDIPKESVYFFRVLVEAVAIFKHFHMLNVSVLRGILSAAACKCFHSLTHLFRFAFTTPFF